MDRPLVYENFVCDAFGYPNKSLDMGGDPACRANAIYFSERNISAVKATVAYGMEIFIHEVGESINVEDVESNRIEGFTGRVINAKNLVEISDLITEFKNTVLGKYFVKEAGITSFKTSEEG